MRNYDPRRQVPFPAHILTEILCRAAILLVALWPQCSSWEVEAGELPLRYAAGEPITSTACHLEATTGG